MKKKKRSNAVIVPMTPIETTWNAFAATGNVGCYLLYDALVRGTDDEAEDERLR